ncbi:MAG: type II toxin-antitoxin system HipA family toxin [Lachnospiraceae bacterium]|nr:type II toxin-antitoxin system HipA family toxin [Lachnospiraceae bacterium]
MNNIKQLNVFYHERKVGTLALYKKQLAAFEYDKDWIENGFPISPFSLPLEKRIFVPKMDPFGGLFGVFADSLPDGWGRLLADRLMLKNHIDPVGVGNLNRLAIVGNSGMGALSYRPDIQLNASLSVMGLDQIAEECENVLKTEYSADLDQLFQLGGSSGGARPKILTAIDNEEWIIKFPSYDDKKNIGKQEYEYSVCAKECGIEMTKTKLFPSERCEGYFGTKRFDRKRDNGNVMTKIHMLSVSAVLETSHRIPNLDYHLLMKLTLEITKDFSEVMKLYRLMCFNVFAHNRDDHSKNFSYLYDEQESRFILAPAYDLTYSNSLNGEHATTVNGNGSHPDMEDILAVAAGIGIREAQAGKIARDIRDCAYEMLAEYLRPV